MKTKLTIRILVASGLIALLFTGELHSQSYVSAYPASHASPSYYDDFGYHYSSRINRFHRSYTYFGYYSPIFTETYWYSYQPYSWGVTIYSGGGYGLRYAHSWSYPVSPVYHNSYYYGYYPSWYDWYTPVVIKVRVKKYYPLRYTTHYGYYSYGPVFRPVNNYYYYGNVRHNLVKAYPSSPYPLQAHPAASIRRSSPVSVSNTVTLGGSRRTVAGGDTQVVRGSETRGAGNENRDAGKVVTGSENRRLTVTAGSNDKNTQATVRSDRRAGNADVRNSSTAVKKDETVRRTGLLNLGRRADKDKTTVSVQKSTVRKAGTRKQSSVRESTGKSGDTQTVPARKSADSGKQVDNQAANRRVKK